MKKTILAIWLVLCFMLISGLAQAAPSHIAKTEHVTAELVAPRPGIAKGTEQFWVGLTFKIIPGWHIYWKNPGDSGEPIKVNWQLPDGIIAGDINWPVPHRFKIDPLANYGYEKNVTLPIQITVPEAVKEGQKIQLKADLTWLVCEEICIPQSGTIEKNIEILPAGSMVDDPVYQNVMAQALPTLPEKYPYKVAYTIQDKILQIELKQALQVSNHDALFFPYEWGVVEAAADQNSLWRGEDLIITAPLSDAFKQTAQDIKGVISFGNNQGYEISASYIPSMMGGEGNMGVIQIIFLAILGGLILNIMPCVFPVLAMKAMSIINHTDPDARRKSGLAYLGGVLASFAVLGSALLLFRFAGEQVGWGFQLQSPSFVLILIYIMTLLGLVMSGALTLTSSAFGIGQSLTSKSGSWGSFFTGVLAVIVATPCTAPFMGVALGAALTLPSILALLVFLALGFGLALPFVLLSFVPALANYLPKPGVWMENLKQVLAFPLYFTAAWLVWVLAQQIGANGVALALFGTIALVFGIWLWRFKRPIWVRLIALLCIAAAVFGARFAGAIPAITTEQTIQSNWQNFDFTRIKSYQNATHPTFIDLTAAWCITCQVNKQVALDTNRVQTFFADNNIRLVRGDWTNYDDTITTYLESFDRTGVPLYVFYPGQGKDPVILPQLLTPSLVIDHLTNTLSDLNSAS